MDALSTLEYMYVKYLTADRDHAQVVDCINAVESLPIGKAAYEEELKQLIAAEEKEERGAEGLDVKESATSADPNMSVLSQHEMDSKPVN
jgi:hypothetical protein